MFTENGKQNVLRILARIIEVRNEHNACTAREVARLEKIDPGLFQRQIEQIRKAGLVTWTRVQGSLTVTEAGVTFLMGSPTPPAKVAKKLARNPRVTGLHSVS